MMRDNLFHVLCIAAHALAAISNAASVEHSVIPKESIGEIFHFPSSLLEVNDVTNREKEIADAKRGTMDQNIKIPTLSSDILAAYEVSSTTPNTFLPCIITVARKGAFLTPERDRLYAKIDAIPEKERKSLGRFDLGNGIKGGVAPEMVRVPSNLKVLRIPHEKMSIVAVANVPSKGIDVRVAKLGSFEGGADIVAVSGGEKYSNALETKGGYEERPVSEFDVIWAIVTLTKVVVSAPFIQSLPDVNTGSQGVP